MSAKGTGSHDDPQNPEKKIYTFTQKVKVFISTFYQLRMILMLHIVTSKNSSEHMFTMFSYLSYSANRENLFDNQKFLKLVIISLLM